MKSAVMSLALLEDDRGGTDDMTTGLRSILIFS